MNDNLIDLNKHRKTEQLVKDLETCIKMIDFNRNSFKGYTKYTPVAEIVSVLETNKTILEIHLNKIKRNETK